MKRTGIFLLIVFTGLLCGCSANELEDRCFPMLAVVDMGRNQEEVAFSYTFPTPRLTEDQETATQEIDTVFAYGSTFEAAWENYEQRLNKEADYNHLKVIVLGEEFIDNQELYDGMLDFLQQKETFPRNAYICVIPDAKKLLELEESLSDDAGTYLEDYLLNHEYGKTRDLAVLGQLMDERENKKMDLALPYIEVEGSNILWEDWYIIKK